ncbi:aldo/keto reductase [Sphingomonas naphthae]|uniref:Aldo/keto reductase n=1 Tax=Sphingomonas naphthae TaxID=1813468 RepID=A0ABY7TQY2_9SPHN|nr:aldo/keto reductase [Sphingomonas naphthae]WCT75396.1 aldo/keto reductase [Sphingomonas naphthae]
MFGGNVFGWTIDKATSFQILDRFVDGGGRAIDTADVYSAWVPGHSGGESEAIIGEWLKASGKRDAVTIATKVGLLPGEGCEGLAATRIAAACDASLRRLGVETIDIYFAHRDDPRTPLEETLAAFDALVKAGKVRTIAASNYTADRLGEALAISDANGWARFAVLEPLYNLVERGEYEGALRDLCVKEGIAVTPYYALAAGYLTGKYRSADDLSGSRADSVRPYLEGKGPAVLAAMDAIAADTGASMVAIALAWLNAKPGIAAPIASATSIAQLDTLLAAARLTLTPEQVAALDTASA